MSRAARCTCAAGAPAVDLELWDAEREAALFRQVFGQRLLVEVKRG